MDKYYSLSKADIKLLRKIQGPILIFGAGGFIGINLLKTLLLYRKDVFGVSQDFKKNFRISTNKIPAKFLRNTDINELNQVTELIEEIKPKTIFNSIQFLRSEFFLLFR